MTSSPETTGLRGDWRDVLRAPDGHVLFDSGIRKNAVVNDCRRLLATFMRGAPTASGISGLAIGRGNPAWDSAGTPAATTDRTALVDANPFVLPLADLTLDFLDGDVASPTPTNLVRIAAVFGAGQPPWPDANHTDAGLREFGLVGDLDGSSVLIDYVTHPVIHKDPVAPLERTIWLRF
ncbi:hypothetical protein [Roseibium marinum]|uniref:Uncharacterized protein n=1 Tax=Roseibium marinum TaxID=281252 RepID=A0A2S3UNK7_9HYPH|nr:hypothetical protein [Roseibium marinum]POF29079.1 hypothetical protein CLV41_11083 [Roseibium marinum]